MIYSMKSGGLYKPLQ